ncbi:Putative cytosolic protein (plasmid) [Borrelia nietonii YOR]|uniref:Putative cytosolic protein n=2 Tax=Borrelia TaxID=138 RepID=W5SBN6_9SPIR|nr:Putative cytosolic protein [Borrelia nietonii YOR]
MVMESVLERLKKKESEIKEKRDKPIFVKIESHNDRTLYHTKIMMDFYAFGISERQNSKFFIAFRGLFNREKVEWFSLFALRDDDKCLGIFYGCRKPIKNVVRRYEENGVMKASTFSKVYYIEFRFKKGSVFCYLRGISYLLREDKIDTKYCKSLIEKLANLEKQVYEFYGKKLPDGGRINKWIEKNLK